MRGGKGADPLRVVAIGGGTGLSALLHGLKLFKLREDAPIPIDITAVVTVTDDGGSSGRLRREFDVLPPGDIRNCMVAMSEDEALLSRLFQHRFDSGRGLKGHSFGNLFLTALTQITGDFGTAVQLSSEVLAICGRIYPSTSTNVGLSAEMADGRVVAGETSISRTKQRIKKLSLVPGDCSPLPETLRAIEEADVITLGPGSLFTSVIPNLLVDGIPEAIRQSKAVKAYFVNLMWQPGETIGFAASDHLKAIHDHAGDGLIQFAIMNTRHIAAPMKRRYAAHRSLPVDNDFDIVEKMGVSAIGVELACGTEKVRHDSAAIAEITIRLAGEGRRRRRGLVARSRPLR
jgi:uncharacterized cofD-like protein